MDTQATPYKGTIQTLAVNAIRRMDVTPACVHSSVTMRETMREVCMCDKDYKAVMNSKIGDTINLEHGGAIDVVAVPYDTRCSRCFNSGKAPIDGNLCYACVFATNNAVATVGEYLAFVEHVDAAAAEPIDGMRACVDRAINYLYPVA